MRLPCCQSMTALLLLTCLVVSAKSARRSSFTITADLDGDGKKERIVLDSNRDPTLTVWRGSTRLWQGVPQKWKPWKVMTAEVDGDGKREIIVGVYKSTRFFPKPHNCLFVYGWDGKQAFPKWLGSSLSKPFTDFIFADLDGDHRDELISIEITREGKQCIAVYSWNGFGFTHEWERGAWKTVRLLEAKKSAIIVNADGTQILIKR